ncbi:MAG: hypothetical protein ACK42C_02705 [Aquificaceae bacterium]
MQTIFSPYHYLLLKAQRGQLDPEDIDLEELVRDFKEKIQELSSQELLREAGSFIEAITELLKLKLYKLFPSEKKERKPRVRLEEVLKVLEPQEVSEDLDWLYSHSVHSGRPLGSKDRTERFKPEPERMPLHREFRIEEYQKTVAGMEWEELKSFLLKVEDRVERIRFLMAWLL